MKIVRACIAVVVLGSAAVACSAAPESTLQTDEAMRYGGGDPGSGDNGGGSSGPSMRAACPSVNAACTSSSSFDWSQYAWDQQQLGYAGCLAPVAWSVPFWQATYALCPRNAQVDAWVAGHPGADESYACDACLGRPGSNSVWVRLEAPSRTNCGTPVPKGGGPTGCSPYCPSGCDATLW